MTSDLEERSYQWQRRYIFAATVLLIVALIVLPLIL
jgi:hypothetical protein